MPIKDIKARRANHASYLRERYRNDPEYRERHKYAVERSRNSRIIEARKIAALAKNGCVLCGERTIECLSLHHTDPNTKEFTVAWAIRSASRKKLISEIGKCICLCENCHRKVHAGLAVLV